jgi:hypothetical protein
MKIVKFSRMAVLVMSPAELETVERLMDIALRIVAPEPYGLGKVEKEWITKWRGNPIADAEILHGSAQGGKLSMEELVNRIDLQRRIG